MKFFILLFVLISTTGHSKEEKVLYEYKKYEKFDLGNLEVKGELIAPGDLTVRERDRKRFSMDLFTRKDFDSIQRRDVDSIR
jgi:hypothetical protein